MKIKLSPLVLGLLLCASTGETTAAGFALLENSAQGMGNAYAGGGAVAEDASTLWFNPASMSRMESQFQSSLHIVSPSFKFTNINSVAAGTGAPLLSGLGGSTPAPQSGDGGSNALVPNLYYIRELNEQFSFGLGVNAPFGLATEYDSNWMGRYQTIKSEITDMNINPAVSYKANSNFSMGAGLSINYIHAELTNAIDFAGACLAKGGGPSCAGAAGGPGQGGNDGLVKVKGDGISFGFNLGLMYEFNEDSRVAFAYRSEIKQKLDAKATFSVPVTISAIPALDAGIRGAFANDGASAKVRLPASFSISGYHRFNTSKFAVMGDATWTGWSSVPSLFIVYDNPSTAGGPSIESLGWQDAWSLSLGLNYYHNGRLTLRTGLAWDESPVPSPELRTPRLPDNDRIWFSIGGSYKFNDRSSADLSYAHVFLDDTRIRRTDAASGTLAGTYKSDAHVFGLQFNYQFD